MRAGGVLSDVLRESATTPITVKMRPSILTCPPMGSWFPHSALASPSESTTLLRLRSRSSKKRPATSRCRVVSKYPGLTQRKLINGDSRSGLSTR